MVTNDITLIEDTAEIGTDVLANLRDYRPSLIICPDTEQFLLAADKRHRENPEWNWRMTLNERAVGTGEHMQIRQEHLVAYCGFKDGKDTHYHYPISPRQYGRHALADLGSSDESVATVLFRWGTQLRDFAVRYHLRPTPTSGGIAAQFLRDERFYPIARRKVPKATNERARPHLPGNHYELAAVPGKLYAAAYVLDQEAAHHRAALAVDLPDSNTMYARGNYRLEDAQEKWCELRHLNGLMGLVKVQAYIPRRVANLSWIPRDWGHAGHRALYLYTNEIADALALGIDIQGVVAGWLSKRRDEGIRRYAEWAVEERGRSPKWLKGTLLSAYGILGAKPKQIGGFYRQAKRGERVKVWLHGEQVPALRVVTERKLQSPVAHLIQRGMIEAEVRARSCSLARELDDTHGIKVYGILADAVITEGRIPLPLLPQPFRVKERLSWVRFRHSQAYEGQVIATSYLNDQQEVSK